MAFVTFPPDTFTSSGCDFSGKKRVVLFIIPLPCNVREEGRKIVKTGDDFPVFAVRAALLCKSPACYCRGIGMAFWTQPPDFAGFCAADLPGSQGIVLDIVPFSGDFRKKCFQVVKARC